VKKERKAEPEAISESGHSALMRESGRQISELMKRHKLTFEEVSELITHAEKYISVPVGIFRSGLGPLEAVVKYLKEKKDLSLHEISILLSRDPTTIWTTYQNALKEENGFDLSLSDLDLAALKVKKDDLNIPISLFAKRDLSVLEAVSSYLKDNFDLGYNDIALILNRDQRTIWTVVNRARKKLG